MSQIESLSAEENWDWQILFFSLNWSPSKGKIKMTKEKKGRQWQQNQGRKMKLPARYESFLRHLRGLHFLLLLSSTVVFMFAFSLPSRAKTNFDGEGMMTFSFPHEIHLAAANSLYQKNFHSYNGRSLRSTIFGVPPDERRSWQVLYDGSLLWATPQEKVWRHLSGSIIEETSKDDDVKGRKRWTKLHSAE